MATTRSRDVLWYGWGDPARARALPAGVVALLEQALGVAPGQRAPVELADVRVPPADLPAAARTALAGVIGAEHLRADHETRVRHTRGRSTADLLRLRAGDAVDAPDAVLLPADHDEVLAVLRVCAAHRVAVVPFGGGTSVVGGLTPRRAGFAGMVALDLRRLDGLVAVDTESLTATLRAGTLAPVAEELLGDRGLTLGHFPQSFRHASLGGFAATRSAGQSSAGYGRFDQLVLGLRAAAPEGELVLGRAPASAAGPDLRQLLLGSEGAFAVITELTLRVRPAPERSVHQAWRFDSFDAGVAALRRLAQHGPLPTLLRLSDEAETAVNGALPGSTGGDPPGGCLAVTGYDGTADEVAAAAAAGADALTALGGSRLPDALGEAWAAGRFEAPHLRDALLGAGAIAETLETATSWSNLTRLRAAVGAALTGALAGLGTPPLVLCHVSHVYPAGASLYFTVVAAAAADPVAQWDAAKRAASAAIVEGGGTISHHHGVGVDHRPWLEAEIGPLGVGVLRAVKDRLDPAGVLNPGVLVP